LRGVLDDEELSSLRQCHHIVHVGRLSIEVHRHDRPRPGCQAAGGMVDVDGEGVVPDVGEDGRRPHGTDRLGGGEERERAGDDLIAPSDTDGPQR
jgi:hypothetical protein